MSHMWVIFMLYLGYILAGTDEKLIHVWRNDDSKEIICRLRGHAGTVHALASLSTGDNIKVGFFGRNRASAVLVVPAE